MKSLHFLVPTLLALILSVCVQTQEATGQGRGQGFRPCPYSPYSCPVKAVCKPFDESGKVAQVLTESLEEGMYPGMVVLMDTKNRGQVRVHLGPVWYLERQEFQLAPGEEIRVKGMCELKGGNTDVVAFELTRGDYILHLRDAQGRPNWEAWRKR
jgi:hypothetical protein